MIGGGRHDQAVDEDSIAGDAVALAFVHDALGDGKALLGRLGDTVLVECQADHVGAVVGHDRQDLVHDLTLAVDRVDDGLAGVASRRRLNGGGVGRVDLQGQQCGALELLACCLDHLDLVDLGQAYVDVEDIGSLLLLANALGHYVIEVAVAQGLLQTLFARGIDTLADDRDAMARDGQGDAALCACDIHGGVVMAHLRHASLNELLE